MTDKFLSPQDAKMLKDDLSKQMYNMSSDLDNDDVQVYMVDMEDINEIIDSHTEQPEEQFDIPVIEVWIDRYGKPQVQCDTELIKMWWWAITPNAIAMPECKWVTLDHKSAQFWNKFRPVYREDIGWVLSEDFHLEAQFVHKSLIPDDCSTAIVEVRHI